MDKQLGFLVFLCALISVLSFVGTASAETWSVDGMNFTEIQEAIDNASACDTILVYFGVYRENEVVNKPVTLKGVGHPIVDANGSGNTITLSADGITLEGFNEANSGSSWKDAGIKVTSCNSIIVNNNGTICESYMGNYGDDYEEKYPDAKEICTTGIWDVPYCIERDNDFYPLTMRSENYVFLY